MDDYCAAATLQQIEEATVYWLNTGWEVWTELTIDTFCGKAISQYESDVAAIVGYVEHNTTNIADWLGFMVDEEAGYGFQPSDLQTLNQYVTSAVNAYTNRPTWWSAEVFAGQGDWSQSTYNSIVYPSYPAPEIATTDMAQLQNTYYGSFPTGTLVTWSTGYPPPYNIEANADQALTGMPLSITHGKTTYYFDNQFCPGSCM